MENPIICGLSNLLFGLSDCSLSESLYVEDCQPLLTTLPTFLSVTENINENAINKERLNRICCQLSSLNIPEETACRLGRQMHYFGKTFSLLAKLLAKGVLLGVTLDEKNNVFEHYQLTFSALVDCCGSLRAFNNQSCQSLLKLEQARQFTQALNEKMNQTLINSITAIQINSGLDEGTAILNQINNILQEGCL